MSRLRRLVLSDRYFYVTCNLHRSRKKLRDADFRILARVISARRIEHEFLLTAWVFLPDHWHAVIGVRYPKTISVVMESIKVSSTRQMNSRRKQAGRLWQGRFFDRALRTVREYNRAVEYIHLNPVKAALVQRVEDWPWSSAREYSGSIQDETTRHPLLPIDRVLLPSDQRTRI
ncbi:MAG: transposase [Acidobacteria bacterium]|nr:MAG: transposase [Acidobacteriota bacterium]